MWLAFGDFIIFLYNNADVEQWKCLYMANQSVNWYNYFVKQFAII